MSKLVLPAILLAMSLSNSVFAADDKSEGETSMKIEEATDRKNTVPGDVDEEITNAKLRAESGSKSKWSMSFTGNYFGASLATPFHEDRPNTNQEPTPPRVRMAGDIGARYRINKNNSISLGTGYSLQRPFHEAKYGDVSDPFVSLNNARKVMGVQNIASTSLYAATNRDEVLLGQQAMLDVSDTIMYDFNGSKFSVGLALEAVYTHFQNNKNELVTWKTDDGSDDTFTAGRRQRDFQLGAYPLMEYALSDKIQLRTVFRPLIFDHVVMKTAGGDSGWSKRRWTQSIGVGIAVARDVYLYPNFQYDWYHWQGDDFNWFRKNTRENSTVGLAATVNIF